MMPIRILPFHYLPIFTLALALSGLSGCRETAVPTAADESEPTLATALATVPSSFSDVQVAAGLVNPTQMALAPDGRIFVSQQGGQIRVIKNGALLPTPFITLSVNSSGERGALGLAFDPAFASNGYVYIYYTSSSGPHNRVSRFTAAGDAATGGETVILAMPTLSSATNHNGGGIHFGTDGKLYIAVGDNADGLKAQGMGNLFGKMLRLNADGTIPTDNPFYGTATGIHRAIWALGLRNPFAFAVQPGSGKIFINDVGNGAWEEIDEGLSGANYGWPNSEGATTNPAYKSPFYAYYHNSGVCAITGGAFYNPPGGGFPSEYTGDYFFADYCGGWIKRIDLATKTVSDFAMGTGSPVDLKTGSDGALYYLSRGSGSVRKISYSASQAPVISQHPANTTVSVGGNATFTVAASGAAPLTYQWQRNQADLSGATGTSYTLNSAQAADNGARFRCRVTNPSGSAMSNEAILSVTTNQPPTSDITSPTAGATFSGGQSINYAGTGTDPQDGILPASAFTWEVRLFHNDGSQHSHPAYGPATGAKSGVIIIPNQGETSPNIWYRFYLTVKDAQGMTSIDSTDIQPIKSIVTLATSPAGLQLRLDGVPVTSPYSFTGVAGMQRSLEAVTPQTFQGGTWTFGSWSQGGSAAQQLTFPASNTTYTATFLLTQQPPGGMEAESATLYRCLVQSSESGYSGTGYAVYVNAWNDYIEWTLNAPVAGNKILDFRYANAGAWLNLRITVNGNVVNSGLGFNTTGSWSAWGTASTTANLAVGNNLIRATAVGRGGPHIDKLGVR